MSFVKNLAVKALSSLAGKQAPSGIDSGSVRILAGAKQTPPKRGTRQILEAYSTMPWLRATTNKISRTVGDTQWRVFAVKNGNGKAIKDPRFSSANKTTRSQYLKEYVKAGELDEIGEHPLLDVLFGGNEFLTGALNFQVLQLHLDLSGEGFMLKQRDDLGVVRALWPIPPHWVLQTPTPDMNYFVIQWESFHAQIPVTEMIWLTDPNPAKPYERGSSGAGALADELETDEFAAKYTKAFFYNSARPDVIISGDNLSPDDTKRLEQTWLDKHQGFWKSFKPFFVAKSVEIKELTQSFKSMQLIDLRKYERDTIHQFWGIPPEILGITDTSNRATIDAADFLFSKNVIAPRVEVLRVILQKDLVAEFDDRIILDYENPVSEDREHKLNIYKAAPWAFTINEWRETAGDEPIDDGEAFMVPFNLSPVEAHDPGLSLVPAITAPPDVEDPEKSGEFIPHVKQEDLTAAQKQLIESVVVAILISDMNDRMEPIITATVLSYGEAQSLLLGTNWFPEDPTINIYIRERMGNEITNVTVTTKERVRATLTQGMLANELIDDLALRVGKVFQDGRRNRARRIARTESVAAANDGSVQGMKQAGVEKKMWISSRDQIVRDTHSAGTSREGITGLDGQIVSLNELFVSPSGATGQFPGAMSTAAESVNCRCTIISPSVRRSSLSETFKTQYWKSFESERKPFERQMLNASRDAFTEQENSALEALRS